jgi:hypothetical protein
MQNEELQRAQAAADEASERYADLFDAELALSRCCDSQEMLREMVQCFFDDVDKLFPRMRAALGTGNLVEVGRLGHRMKGTAVYLGTSRRKRPRSAWSDFQRPATAPFLKPRKPSTRSSRSVWRCKPHCVRSLAVEPLY